MSKLTERLRNLTNDCGFIDGAVAADRIEHLERVLMRAREAMNGSYTNEDEMNAWHIKYQEALAAIDEALKAKT